MKVWPTDIIKVGEKHNEFMIMLNRTELQLIAEDLLDLYSEKWSESARLFYNEMAKALDDPEYEQEHGYNFQEAVESRKAQQEYLKDMGVEISDPVI